MFIARKRGGFCNNLKCYLSSMRYAEAANSRLLTECADLNMVFEGVTMVPEGTDTAQLPGLSDWRLHVFPEDRLEEGFATSKLAIGYGGTQGDGKNIDFEYARIPSSLQTTYLALIESLKIRAPLQKFVDQFSSAYFDANTASVHMRTWMTDSWDKAPRRHAHFFKFENYVKAIEERQPHKVFLSSDNASYAAQLKDRFGEALIMLPEDHSFNRTEEAFVSLLLLSRNPVLFGSNVSTFTEMAWWYSGCQSQVVLL